VRPASVAGALDHFSGADTPQPSSNPDQTSDASEPSNPDSEAQSEEDAAHEMGAKAHTNGIGRKAVPTEFRTPENSHLAKAWITGWDSVA